MRLAGWAALTALLALAPVALGADPFLSLDMAGRKSQVTREQLLSRAQEIDIPLDAAYRQAMKFRAVPLAVLLAGVDLPADGVLEVVATDGFVAQIPLALVLARGADQAEAWLAIEPVDAPWPALSGKTLSAGPFYLVWLRPERAAIGAEQWPYQIAALRSVDAPHKRWPQLAVDAALPGDDPARLGQALYVKHCIACHRLSGGGAASVGPDLNLPANPTEYFKPDALRRYIRDPKSLRHWPEQRMAGFDAAMLPEADLDALIAYLAHMAGRK